jgi:MYXO-CTERM domain-containing protein
VIPSAALAIGLLGGGMGSGVARAEPLYDTPRYTDRSGYTDRTQYRGGSYWGLLGLLGLFGLFGARRTRMYESRGRFERTLEPRTTH